MRYIFLNFLLHLLCFKGSMRNQVGSRWERTGGRMRQIDSGPFGFVWGVSKYYKIYYRTGITWKNPRGSGWRHVKGNLKYVSVGAFGPWGVDRYNKIWFRYGVSRSRLQGSANFVCSTVFKYFFICTVAEP